MRRHPDNFDTPLREGGQKRMNRIRIVVEKAKRNYSAYSPDLPGCVATGVTRAEAERNMHEAIEMHLRGLQEDSV